MLTLFIAPLITEGAHAVNFIIALFVVPPAPLMSVPFLAMVLYLLLSKKPRRIDIVVIIASVMLLLSLLSTAAYVILLFFLPFIMFGTPFGLLFISILVVVLVILRRRKRGIEAQKPTFAITLFACPQCGRDLSTLPKDITLCPYCGGKLV